MTDDFVRSENGTPVLNTSAAYGSEVMGTNYTAFPDFNVKVNDSKIIGNKAMITWTVTGTNKGEFNGNPPTGKSVNINGLSVWTFNEEGKATREDAYYDKMEMVTQLGYSVTPPQ